MSLWIILSEYLVALHETLMNPMCSLLKLFPSYAIMEINNSAGDIMTFEQIMAFKENLISGAYTLADFAEMLITMY